MLCLFVRYPTPSTTCTMFKVTSTPPFLQSTILAAENSQQPFNQSPKGQIWKDQIQLIHSTLNVESNQPSNHVKETKSWTGKKKTRTRHRNACVLHFVSGKMTSHEGNVTTKPLLQRTEFEFNRSLLFPHFSSRFYAVNPVVKRRQGAFWHSARCIDAWDGCVAVKTTFFKGQRKHLRL